MNACLTAFNFSFCNVKQITVDADHMRWDAFPTWATCASTGIGPAGNLQFTREGKELTGSGFFQVCYRGVSQDADLNGNFTPL